MKNAINVIDQELIDWFDDTVCTCNLFVGAEQFIDTNLRDKTLRVISSCKTLEQLAIASRFAYIALKKHCRDEGYRFDYCEFRLLIKRFLDWERDNIENKTLLKLSNNK